MHYYCVNSKIRRHAIICMLFLLIVLSLQNVGIIRNSYAFDFVIPEIPFLNFNFNIGGSSSDEHTISSDIEESEDSNLISEEASENGQTDVSQYTDADNSVLAVEKENEFRSSNLLPFPLNTLNSAIHDNIEEEKEVKEGSPQSDHDFSQISSFTTHALPLISDYSDFPSTILLDSSTEVGNEIPNQYIVVFNDDDSSLTDFFSTISEKVEFQGIELLQVYEQVLNGIAIKVPNSQTIEAIKNLPMVDYVESDVLTEAFAQTTPTGINRIDADLSSTKSGNGNENVDVDIAIIDSGIDLKHPDLNVYHQKSFVNSNTGLLGLFRGGTTATTATTATANDDHGHGTHVAGIAAAKDNTIGSVGVAPGAKLWAIKVLDSKGTGPLSTVIKGIDYVTSHASQIEVANLSLGCECKSTAFDTAINEAVKAGIVFVVAAGNAGKDAINTSPSNNPNVISVSAMADSDGKCGAQGQNTGYGGDDSLATFSNYGSVIDIAAPGTKIFSTFKDNTYATMSGTSIASPHVAGAAALYLATNPDASPLVVKSALLNNASKVGTDCDGNGFGYFGGDKDQVKEPLLYVKNY